MSCLAGLGDATATAKMEKGSRCPGGAQGNSDNLFGGLLGSFEKRLPGCEVSKRASQLHLHALLELTDALA